MSNILPDIKYGKLFLKYPIIMHWVVQQIIATPVFDCHSLLPWHGL